MTVYEVREQTDQIPREQMRATALSVIGGGVKVVELYTTFLALVDEDALGATVCDPTTWNELQGQCVPIDGTVLGTFFVPDALDRVLNGLVEQGELSDYAESVKASWVYEELHRGRNFGPAMHKLGTFLASAFTFIDQNIFFGKLPFTWRNTTPDHAEMIDAKNATVIDYPKPDGVISFDRLSSVYLSSTNHEEDQPSHLKLKDASVPISVNLPTWDEPAQRYCPAGVYEVVDEGGEKRFQINAQNCVHCKTCEIKDPTQNTVWTVPEGAGGPNYSGM